MKKITESNVVEAIEEMYNAMNQVPCKRNPINSLILSKNEFRFGVRKVYPNTMEQRIVIAKKNNGFAGYMGGLKLIVLNGIADI